MRLLGVVKSTSALLSRLGVGCSKGGWIIEEFTAQMRAVSKIALHRRSNLASFLENNGTFGVLDTVSLCCVFVVRLICSLLISLCMFASLNEAKMCYLIEDL